MNFRKEGFVGLAGADMILWIVYSYINQPRPDWKELKRNS